TVRMGQGPGPAGRHSSVIVSMSFRAGLSLDLAATRIVHAPIFLPFFLVRTLMPTNEPQGDCAGVISSFLGWQWPVVRMVFSPAASLMTQFGRHLGAHAGLQKVWRVSTPTRLATRSEK